MKKYFINVLKIMGVMLCFIGIILILIVPLVNILIGKSLWWCCLYLLLPFLLAFNIVVEIKGKNEI